MTRSFQDLVWQKDRVLLNDLVFRFEHNENADWDKGAECFRFYKDKRLIDQYANFWSTMRDFSPQNVLELGIWDGGSTVFWFELFQPGKHVAIDLSQRGDSDYFQRYIKSRGLESRIRTYWATDQADSARLFDIIQREFRSPIDLVIDDASHVYGATKASLEALFPHLRRGGLYIIEDWAWARWKHYQPPADWPAEADPTRLIFELAEAAATSPNLIAGLRIFSGFIVIERGDIEREDLADLRLEDYIFRRPLPTGVAASLKRIRKRIREVLMVEGGSTLRKIGREILRSSRG